MKKITLLVLLLSFTIAVFAQEVKKIDNLNYIATYSMVHQVNAKNEASKVEEKMFLLIGSKISKYQSEYRYLKDSIDTHHFKNNTEASVQEYMLLPTTYQEYTIIKNRETETMTTNEDVMVENLEYEQPMSDIKWNLTDETQIIVGYTCQKATLSYGGRDFVAWFTNQIPVNEGAYKFVGLPGFLVNISDTQNHSVIQLISITKNTDEEKAIYEVEGKRKTIKTTREKFMQTKEKSTKTSVLGNFEASGMSVTFDDPKVMEEMRKKTYKIYNPIELK